VKQLEDVAEKGAAELGDTLTKREGTATANRGLTVPGADTKVNPKAD